MVSLTYPKTRALCWTFIIIGILLLQSSTARLSAPSVPGLDKIAHFLYFGLLATQLQLSGLTRCKTWLTFLCVVLFGLSDELHQLFTQGRDCSLLDLACDSSGAALALTLLQYAKFYRTILLRPLARSTPS
jgi:VanZ family protein